MIPPARHLTSVGLGTTSERAVAIATRRGPGYLQRLKRKPGLLGCAEEALKVAVEYFTGLAAAGHDLAAHLQVLDVDSATGITLLVGVVSRKPRNFRQPINMACLALGR